MFEIWLTFSAAKLAGEITSDGIHENGKPYARKYYGALHVFVLLTHFVRYLKHKFAAKIAQLPSAGPSLSLTKSGRTQPGSKLTYLDSS